MKILEKYMKILEINMKMSIPAPLITTHWKEELTYY